MSDVAVSADAVGVAPDPSATLQRAFAEISATRMRDMPLVNDALRVEALGFQRWNGLWLGALVTPWFINLMLLPDQPAQWPRRRIGEKAIFAFPAGRFEFIAGREPLIAGSGTGAGAGRSANGEYLSCSLFSPVFEFADHETARLVAEMALAGLFDETNFEVPDMRVSATSPQTLSRAAAQAAAEAEAAEQAGAAQVAAVSPGEHSDKNVTADAEAQTDSARPVDVSKRDFLRGRWHGEGS